MKPREVDRSKTYSSGEDYFNLEGSAIMILTANAAIEVCVKCIERQEMVLRIEGGILHHPEFEARLDCIWDAKEWLKEDPSKNNRLAIQFIEEELNVNDAFIITTSRKAA